MKRLQILALCISTTGYVAGQAAGTAMPGSPGSSRHSVSFVRTGHSTGSQNADLSGGTTYADHCAICHGKKREGIVPGFPPLLGVKRHMTDQQVAALIHAGKGRMPGFPALQQGELTALLRYLSSDDLAASTMALGSEHNSLGPTTSGMDGVSGALFQQNCAFCHGRDAQGGETGPDLTRSKLVLTDVKGDKISEVIRNGRPEKKMPAFNFSSEELLNLAAFIHAQEARAVAQKGKRKGVDVSDLQTGTVAAGQQYFDGAGTCSTCHSAKGDLAGVATRYEGLQLEERMLYPKDVKGRLTVTLPSGERITGSEAYLDEFTVALRDSEGIYRSWAAGKVRYSLDSPVQSHADLFSKYTDEDIHNLMAYLQTLR